MDLNASDAHARGCFAGVLFARQDKLDEAIREWEEAKKLDPKNPRIDLLIEEARRRKYEMSPVMTSIETTG